MNFLDKETEMTRILKEGTYVFCFEFELLNKITTHQSALQLQL